MSVSITARTEICEFLRINHKLTCLCHCEGDMEVGRTIVNLVLAFFHFVRSVNPRLSVWAKRHIIRLSG